MTRSVAPVSSSHVENAAPALTAVGGLVDPTFAARSKEASERGHVNDVEVARIDEDAGDVA